jgi:hypothetical protein
LAVCIAALLPALCFGQDTSQPTAPPASSPTPSRSLAAGQGLPRFGIQVSAGTLGAGIQAATAVTRRSNVRFGVNYFKYSGSTSKDNITYNGTLRLESAEVLYDQYIGGGFHISPGVMVYDGNQGTANASVSAGQTFSLNGVTYYSSNASPVTGTGTITSRKIAPELLIGFGNLLPRSARHFTLNFDLGVVFQGSANAKLNLNGSTCLNDPINGCLPISTNTAVQSNIQLEQTKINNSLGPFKFYPVLRLGFGYKF